MGSIWKLMGSPWRRLSQGRWCGQVHSQGGLAVLWHLDAHTCFGVVGLPAFPITLQMAFSIFQEGWLCFSVIKAGSTDTSGTHHRNPSLICCSSALARSWLETFDVCKRALRAHVKHPFIHILWVQAQCWVSSSESHVSGPQYPSPLQKCFHSVKI